MGLSCGMSLKTSSTIIVFIELIAAVTVGALCALNWKIVSSEQSVIYFHKAQTGESPDVTNAKILACVTFWILTCMGLMAILHLILAFILFSTVKKKSELLAKAWIALKAFGLILVVFLCIGSMTTFGWYTKGTTLASLLFHLITLPYIKILYESMSDFEAILITKSLE